MKCLHGIESFLCIPSQSDKLQTHGSLFKTPGLGGLSFSLPKGPAKECS